LDIAVDVELYLTSAAARVECLGERLPEGWAWVFLAFFHILTRSGFNKTRINDWFLGGYLIVLSLVLNDHVVGVGPVLSLVNSKVSRGLELIRDYSVNHRGRDLRSESGGLLDTVFDLLEEVTGIHELFSSGASKHGLLLNLFHTMSWKDIVATSDLGNIMNEIISLFNMLINHSVRGHGSDQVLSLGSWDVVI